MHQESGDVLLHGIGIGGYRSMPDPRYFAPLAKVSLLAGQNNVGKSNVIRFLERYFVLEAPRRVWEDEPQGLERPLEMAIAYRLDREKYEEWVPDGGKREQIDQFFALPPFHPTPDPDLIWVTRSPSAAPNHRQEQQTAAWVLSPQFISALEAEGSSQGMSLQMLRHGLFSTTGGSVAENVMAVINQVFPFQALPKVEVIHAFRRVVADEGEPDNSGVGLIPTLSALQHPVSRDRHRLRAKFDEINRFLKTVMEDDSVEIEIPSVGGQVQIHQGGAVFPLEDLGTGIHQVLILATAATLHDRSIVCIEEPEVNLHPILQRKFVRYLTENTTNQYVIATHSAHMLDYERASIIHVRKDETGSVPSRAVETQAVSDVCTDLGYRPSDVLQSNAVIWVEGPSDRTYLQHWLRLVEPGSPFVEGIHYSIMFYGGRMLSHLTGEDPSTEHDVQEFISLRRLNRHSAIIIDSDRHRARAPLNPTKDRAIKEFDRSDMPGHAWVTACRTIENYIPPDVLRAAVESVHPGAVHRYSGDKWDDPLSAVRSADRRKAAALHKVKIASAVTERWDETTPMKPELKKEVKRIHTFIADAN